MPKSGIIELSKNSDTERLLKLMSHCNTVLNQMLNFLPRHQFQKIVDDHNGDYRVRQLTCWSQFVSLLFAQLSSRKGLRDVENSILSNQSKLYHLGIKPVKRSTLSDANNNRPFAIYEQTFNRLLESVRQHAPHHGFKFRNPVKALDATTIDLCMTLFPWAEFRSTKSGIRLHTVLDQKGKIPSFVVMSDAKTHEIEIARTMNFEPGDIIVMDRGYTDYSWFYQLEGQKVFFVTRIKSNAKHRVIKNLETRSDNILRDQLIEFTSLKGKDYPKQLRKVTFYDEEEDRTYEFLTNIRHLSASTIADLYKSRWNIEIFFKEIKQNLKIKSFLGTSRNAVMTQIWVALIAYLMLALLKFISKGKHSISSIARLIQVNLLQKIHLRELIFLEPPDNSRSGFYTQLAMIKV